MKEKPKLDIFTLCEGLEERMTELLKQYMIDNGLEINEGKNNVKTGKKMEKSSHEALPSAHRVGGGADRHYDLGRLLTVVAAEDGTGNIPNDIPDQSWAGRNNTAHPYTKTEADMLKKSYEKLGLEWDDVLKPNPNNISRELDDNNKKSPIQPFSGYIKKRKK